MRVTLVGGAAMQASLSAVPKLVKAEMREALKRSALQVHTLARKYTPISPTQAQKNLARKTKRKVKRKATATTRAKPGGLTRSIEYYAGKDYASVFVASNSEGGSYAKKIHDERFKSWRNLGIGSRAKGNQAREKFIDRAAKDALPKIERIFQAVFKRVNL